MSMMCRLIVDAGGVIYFPKESHYVWQTLDDLDQTAFQKSLVTKRHLPSNRLVLPPLTSL